LKRARKEVFVRKVLKKYVRVFGVRTNTQALDLGVWKINVNHPAALFGVCVCLCLCVRVRIKVCT